MEDFSAAGPPSLVISQYWDHDDVPGYLAGPVATFRRQNPDFLHRVFSKAQTERFIAEHFGRRELEAFQACAVPSMQSDYFRYCAVLALGGVYADVDFRCNRPFRPLVDRSDAGEIFLGPTEHPLNERRTRRVWSQFFAFREPGHPFLRLALDIATANIEERLSERIWPVGEKVVESIWLTVGPGIFTLMRFMRDWGSFDAFVAGLAKSPMEAFAKPYCEVVGDYSRLLEAFDGVKVSPHESMTYWVDDVDWAELPYKETEMHWHNFKAAIFR